jgi:predicted O-methyltransferase YrrM
MHAEETEAGGHRGRQASCIEPRAGGRTSPRFASGAALSSQPSARASGVFLGAQLALRPRAGRPTKVAPLSVGLRAPERLRAVVHRRRLARGLARVVHLHEPVARNVADALRAALGDRLEPAEAQWVERIEAQRRKLESSAEELVELTADGRPSARLVAELTRIGSVSPRWALVLFMLVRRLEPASCLELGTCVGISAAYQGAALELNGSGRLVTLEAGSARAALAERNLADLGVRRATVRVGLFQDTLESTMGELAPIEYAFVDGHHERDATIQYFEQLLLHAAENAVLVFDDINWSPGMRDAWAAIRNDRRVRLWTDVTRFGICVVRGTTVL